MGIKSNISYNLVLTLSGYVIGLITFPYVSRVLGVSNLGVISFVDNTINYFILFATLGASTIGTREIARFKGDKDKVNAVFTNLILLYTIYSVIVILLYFIAVTFIDKLNIYRELFYIGSAKLLFSVFLIEWLYRGLENFKFITTRSLIIKLIYVLSIFIFVNDRNDYIIYFVLTTLSVVINGLINIFYSKNIVKFVFHEINLKPYLKQSIILGSYSILTSVYTTFNIMYLGFVSDTIQVGYYWASIKIYTIILGFYTAFTGAIMPRMSSLLSSGEKEEFNELIVKSFDILFAFCFPLIIFSIIHSPQIIHILSGSEFGGAIFPMKIIMPLVLVVGIAQILAIQVLIPLQKDKIILHASIIGAIVSVFCNVVFVKKLGATGSAIVLLFSEIAVTSYYILKCRKSHIVKFPYKKLVKYFIISLPYIFICNISLKLFIEKEVAMILFTIVLFILYFVYSHKFLLKSDTINKMFGLLINNIKNN